MELYDEEVEKRKTKVPIIIGVSISVLIVITILIVIGIVYLKKSIRTIQIDGVRNIEIEKIFYIESTEEGKQLYLPIIKIAKYLGYEGFTGDYEEKSEDKSRCHVISKNEIAMFSLDSDIIVKMIDDSENENIKIDKKVFEINGELYTTIDGIQKAFNVLFSYDEEFKNVQIYSMNYLLKTYAQNLRVKKYSTKFLDKKAIFEGLIIFIDNGQYGVMNIKNKEQVLQAKYQEIKYIPTTTDFIVKSNGKYGIVTKDASIKVKTVYDQIKIIDNKNGLYLVRQNDSYGVVDLQGNILIQPEYNQIGISNIEEYAENGVENKYLLFDQIIPVKNQDNLWALFNIKGEKVTDFKYSSIGCKLTPVSNSYPVLVIPSHKIIVVKTNKKYNLVTLDGKEMIGENILDSIYLKYNLTTNENEFFMTSSNNTVSVSEWLTSIGQ